MALLLPIKTKILSAFSRKDEPPGVCPECEQEGADEQDPRRRAVRDMLERRGHTKDEAREIERGMMNAAREMMGLPPLRDEGTEPPKDN